MMLLPGPKGAERIAARWADSQKGTADPPPSIRAELAQFIDISNTLAIVLMFHQHCTNHAPECPCKLSLLYDVAV
jgi:hypothetical protein